MAVLDDIMVQDCDRILCLGDLVDGGDQAVEVVQTIRERGIPTVQGNHDETAVWDYTLPESIRSYLGALPQDIAENGVLYTHTSPRVKKDKIRNAIDGWNVFEETDWRRIFVGDVHIPMVLGQRCDQMVSSTEYQPSYGEEFMFDPSDRYIVCVGAVGYSRDGYHRLRYVIYDSDRDSIEFRAPEGPILRF
jgi:diadenosine tetraphosphatase ApaH/serine/threonine PP2A family protein phosphatase